MKAGVKVKRCVYCGARTDQPTCKAHRDLPALDPEYARG